jgi:glycine dehydrogenase subunit 1
MPILSEFRYERRVVSYLFNTPEQQQEMLRACGVDSIEKLFSNQVPDDLRLHRPLNMPPPLSELELESEMTALAARNHGVSTGVSFFGGGAYDHFIPAVVDTIAGRSEFYTAYTPYQAEASQGTLQAFFEYQTLICQLTGMDVSNASLYEGGTSVTEAVSMALRVLDGRRRVVVLGSVHPEYRDILVTHLPHLNVELITIPTPNGTADLDLVTAALDEQTACLVIQQPNFFGCLEDSKGLIDAAHKVGALAILSFDPLSLGLLPRPGDLGADIAVAEGQTLGTPLQYGGPFLGILTCRESLMRKMPGRLIGETTDRLGKRCFVLNLQAREQHIKRDKATSNICTNQGLLALRATVYMALLGPKGFQEVAELSCRKAHYAAQQLATVPGIELLFDRPFFKEFAIRCSNGIESVVGRARSVGFNLGPDLARFEWQDNAKASEGLLIAVTEKRTRAEIDRLVQALKG